MGLLNFLKRIFRIGQAEVNSGIDKLENPIKMTEQGIRDLKKDLNKSVEALASVKAMAIRSKKETDQYSQKSKDYERKAMALLQRAESGQMDAGEAERLAKEALTRKRENEALAATASKESQRLGKSVDQMQGKIQNLRSNIGTWENELKTLKSRVKVSEATKKLNKQLSDVDSSSTVALLERMREKVTEQESLAESYEQLAQNANTNLDTEIDSALDGIDVSADDDLLALKAKMSGKSGGGAPAGGEMSDADLDLDDLKAQMNKDDGPKE